MHGPGGFTRRFKGRAGAGPEVTARHDADGVAVRLALTNAGTEEVQLTIEDAYGHDHQATYRLRPGGHAVHTAQVRTSHGWYDLSVRSDQDDTYLRRLAGHVETGSPSTSDPAIATH